MFKDYYVQYIIVKYKSVAHLQYNIDVFNYIDDISQYSKCRWSVKTSPKQNSYNNYWKCIKF